jgi:hypothetical protein
VTGAAVDGSFILGLTVTVHAPTHAQTGNLLHSLHLLNISMAGRAVLTRFDVRCMIELHVIREQMNLLPRNWFVIVIGIRDLFDPGTVGFDDHMAVHTDV